MIILVYRAIYVRFVESIAQMFQQWGLSVSVKMFASVAQALFIVSLIPLAFAGDRYKKRLSGGGTAGAAASNGSGAVEYGDLDDAAINREIMSCVPLLVEKVGTLECPSKADDTTVESQCRNSRYDGSEVSMLTIQCAWPDPKEGLAYGDDLTVLLLTACDDPDTKESKQHVVLEILDRLCGDVAELRGKAAKAFWKALSSTISSSQKLQMTGYKPPPLVKLTLGKFLISLEASFKTCKSDAITVSECVAWPPGPTLSSTECAAEIPKMHSEYGKKEGNTEAEAYKEHEKAKSEAAKRIENVKVNLLMLSANYIENSRKVVKGGSSGRFRQSKVMRYFKNLLCDASLSGKTFKKSLLFGWNNFEKALVDASKNVSF